MWIIYSLLTALSLSTSDALAKRAVASRDVYFVAWARLLFALPVFLVLLLFVEIPPLDRTFWFATVAALPLEVIAMILYTRVLKVSPLGLTMPFLALTPMFLIVTSYLILGEKVSYSGGVGILCMAVGVYTLNIHRIRENFMGPVRAILREKGSVLMITVAFIYSITSSLGKMAIEHSSPIFFGSLYFVLVFILLTPLAMMKSRDRLVIGRKDIGPLMPVGLTYAMMITFHMIAMSMVNVAYMISVKRTSLLFSIIYGALLFKEEKIGEKFIGGVIMLTGFVLIVIGR